MKNKKQDTEFLLYHEVYTIYLDLFPLLNKFPKSQKFTLRQKIDDTFLDLLLTIERYQKSQQQNKSTIIKRISYLFDKSKLLIRISKDLHILPYNHYISLLQRFDTIGKLIGGMLKKK